MIEQKLGWCGNGASAKLRPPGVFDYHRATITGAAITGALEIQAKDSG
ncbi:MAG TPA: hypothetical protein V6C57_03755 [Coleofasciculaceae cyanobacterium]